MSRPPHVKNIIFASLFTAMITVMTAYVGHIPTATGYIHFGDGLIFLAACFLPKGYAIAAAALGGGLADLLTYPLWTIPTLLIKGLMALPFSNKSTKILTVRNCIAAGIAMLINTTGYFIAGAIFASNWMTPIADLPNSLIQGVGSLLIFILTGLLLDKQKGRIYHG